MISDLTRDSIWTYLDFIGLSDILEIPDGDSMIYVHDTDSEEAIQGQLELHNMSVFLDSDEEDDDQNNSDDSDDSGEKETETSQDDSMSEGDQASDSMRSNIISDHSYNTSPDSDYNLSSDSDYNPSSDSD